ncbi:hypothetical protein FJZ55_01375, partial [Candidatus Woesearchaeota archaeon]|nr:hypothetical protein [Candidatus Woesearchaeota archaeon]
RLLRVAGCGLRVAGCGLRVRQKQPKAARSGLDTGCTGQSLLQWRKRTSCGLSDGRGKRYVIRIAHLERINRHPNG